ncbi:MAG: M24 family metallopeptidase [Candidatus Promineifilaceae bacterium]
MNQNRINKVATALREQGLDWMALVPSPSMIYLSGIHTHMSERPIVMFVSKTGETGIIIPALEAMKAESAGIASEHIFAWTDQQGYHGAFAQAAQVLGLNQAKIGVEALKMRVLENDMLVEMGRATVSHADNLMDTIRLSKDADEIAAMQKAVDVAEAAMARFLPTIRIGMSEKELAMSLTQMLLDAGGDSMAFGPIVSAGPDNTASPHAVPTDRPIEAGDLLILDWGVYVGDYVSDITRTYAVGEISAECRKIYETVKASNAAGVAASRPNVTGEEIDKASRDVIDQAGYGDYFIHRTGHGLGMEAHEAPSLVEGNNNPLPVGAAFTVEPGIYIAGIGGVRIEDDIILTEDGHICLTSISRELTTVGVSK